MHNAAFCALKINAEYKLFPLKEDEIEEFLKNLTKRNIYGLNVTIPYKEKVLPFLQSLSEEAKLIGAVNTIRVSENKLEGFNTDAEGFFKHLTEDLGFNPEGKTIAIMGAGGAGRAVSVYLCKAKPKRIAIYDIDKDKLFTLVNHLKENFRDVEIKSLDSLAEPDMAVSDLLVNATPIGMKQTDPCLVDEKLIHKNLFVYDLIYNPSETNLLKVAKHKGAKVSNGLGMLLYQGMLSFEIWIGKTAPLDIMRQALQKELTRCRMY